MNSAPLLSQIKSWQLVGLGISGWVTLYSVAVISWGAGSAIIGNTQGGCFAITMTLAGIEARRFRRRDNAPTPSADSLEWISDISTEHVNQVIKQIVVKQGFLVEKPHRTEYSMGFGVRAVNSGRTLVFETEHWAKPMVDLLHVQTTEENRRKVLADLAIIVGAGMADEATQLFVKEHALQLLLGEEFKNLMDSEKIPGKPTPSAPKPVTDNSKASD